MLLLAGIIVGRCPLHHRLIAPELTALLIIAALALTGSCSRGGAPGFSNPARSPAAISS